MEEGLVLLNGITLIISNFSSILLSILVILLYRGDDADIAYTKWTMDNTTMRMDKKSA